MAVVRWQPEALDSLIEHDIWRMGQGWEPVIEELMRAIEAYFEPQAPERPSGFMPGRPATLAGEQIGLRMVPVTVRSKAFRVYFRYRPEMQCFEIVQVLHPRAR